MLSLSLFKTVYNGIIVINGCSEVIKINQLLIDILEACSGVFDIFIEDMRYGILKNENRKTELNECHRHLVDALREGDREKGLQALKWHFEMIDEILG